MKRFWLKILLLVPLPLIVVGFTWFVDPVHLRNADQYEYGIARLILDGKRVTNISNPNEAAYIKFVVDGLKTRKDVLVLGSSRSKLLRSDSFAGRPLFNNSIAGGGLVDYLAIYHMYRQKGLIPSVVVVELSPWILMRDYASIWKTLNANKQDLERWVLSTAQQKPEHLETLSSVRADFSEFLSLGYFQTSFYTWANRTAHPKKHQQSYFVWQEGTLPMGETVLADGSAIYPEYVEHSRDREQVTALAVEYAQKPAGVPNGIDPDCQKVLEAFLDQLAHDGVRAILYLPPYHPKTYTLMVNSPQNRIILAEQKYYEELAQRKGLTLVGSYNPADFDLGETAFFDGSHPTQEAVRKLFATCLPGEGVMASAKINPPDRVELVGVDNPNGLEVVHEKPFFWIGGGDTCLSVRSPREGAMRISFHAEPGPSLPTTPIRNLGLRTADGFTKSVVLKDYPNVEIAVPINQGQNEICLSPLDKPTVLEQPNGDRRPLLVGVSNLQVEFLPDDAVAVQRTALPYEFASGWHAVEHNGPDWLCWTDGRGRLSLRMGKDSTVTLSGEILSGRRPNNVDLVVNGEKVRTFAIDWTEWAFRPFDHQLLKLKAGLNVIEFVSEKPALVQQSDPRPLAVAIKNVTITEVYDRHASVK
jgi:hypothetical protein